MINNNNKNSESINIEGPAGILELVVHNIPGDCKQVGIVCSPHPLYKGTMQNKVVTTVVKAFSSMEMPCIRFNFRGVGNSEGSFSNAIGEIEDCIAVVDWAKNRWLEANVWLAGFSFGAYIATMVSLKREVYRLINIAPPVHMNEFNDIELGCPCLVVQGIDDEIVPALKVYEWFDGIETDKELIKMANTTHFFHGKLNELYTNIKQYYRF